MYCISSPSFWNHFTSLSAKLSSVTVLKYLSDGLYSYQIIEREHSFRPCQRGSLLYQWNLKAQPLRGMSESTWSLLLGRNNGKGLLYFYVLLRLWIKKIIICAAGQYKKQVDVRKKGSYTIFFTMSFLYAYICKRELRLWVCCSPSSCIFVFWDWCYSLG